MSGAVVVVTKGIDWFADKTDKGPNDDETYSATVPAATDGVGRGTDKYSSRYTGSTIYARVDALTTAGTLVVVASLYGMINSVWYHLADLNNGNNLSLAATPRAVYAVAGGHQLRWVESFVNLGGGCERYTVLLRDLQGTNLNCDTYIGFVRA